MVMTMMDLTIILCVFGFFVVIGTALYADFVKFCNHSVPVFAYHRITTNKDIYSMPPDVFESQMKYLHDNLRYSHAKYIDHYFDIVGRLSALLIGTIAIDMIVTRVLGLMRKT